ncbi:hypothetical protein [Maribacter litoralis]|uniref:hypothetical protein n=1 Tax=Maribacter litoralis TaxID=2059726 RepID=UPI000E316093|nr:hypothetical protein [Maribacter litoralis]
MELTINDTNDNFETWLNKEFVTADLKKLLTDKSILLIPFENLRDTQNPLMFPIGTENILRYFKENLPANQTIDICIKDEDYQEFAFYSDYKRLGNFLVKSVAIAVFVNVLSAYVYDQYIKEDNTKPQIQIIDKSTNTTINNHISNLSDKKYLEPTHIKFSVTVVDSVGKSKNISYEGPASEIDSVLKSLKDYEE